MAIVIVMVSGFGAVCLAIAAILKAVYKMTILALNNAAQVSDKAHNSNCGRNKATQHPDVSIFNQIISHQFGDYD